jgi:hypothetical protein
MGPVEVKLDRRYIRWCLDQTDPHTLYSSAYVTDEYNLNYIHRYQRIYWQ